MEEKEDNHGSYTENAIGEIRREKEKKSREREIER